MSLKERTNAPEQAPKKGRHQTSTAFLSKAQLDADAAVIVAEAERTARIIMQVRHRMDIQGNEQKPLIVLAGETHDILSHHLHHMVVISILHGEEPSLAVSEEYPHTILEDFFLADIPPGLALANANGELSLKATLSSYTFEYAPHANNVFQHFLLRRKISTCFSDAKKTGKFLIYENGSSTARSIHACFNQARVPDHIQTTSATGLAVRNHHMVEQTLAHAERHRMRIIFHKCGEDHVIGSKADRAATSLAAFYKKHGADIVGLFLSRSEDKAYWQDTLEDHEGIHTAPLPTISAVYDSDHDKPFKGRPTDIASCQEEATYVNGVLQRAGLYRDCLLPRDSIKLAARLTKEMNLLSSRYLSPAIP